MCRSGTRAVWLSQAIPPSTKGSGTIASPRPTSSPAVPVWRRTRWRISTPQPARVSTAVAVTAEKAAGRSARRRPGAGPGAVGPSRRVSGSWGSARPGRGTNRWARRLRGPGMVRVSAVGVGISRSSAARTVRWYPSPDGVLTRHRVGQAAGRPGGVGRNRPRRARPPVAPGPVRARRVERPARRQRRRNSRSCTTWPLVMPARSNLVTGRQSGRGA